MESQEVRSDNRHKRFKLSRNVLVGLVVVIALAVAGIGVLAASDVTDDSDVGEIESIAPGALSVTDTQARQTVLDAYPGTTVEELDLDTQSDGTLVYDVSLDNGQEIMVNARTGEILGAEADDADDIDGDDVN